MFNPHNTSGSCVLLFHFTGGKQNNVMVPLHTHQELAQNTEHQGEKEEVFKSTSTTRPKAEGGSSMEWGEGPQRVEGRYGWVCPQGGLPELEPARQQGKRWARPRRTGMGVRVRLGEGPKSCGLGETSWSHPAPCTDGGIEAQVRTETYFRPRSLPDAQLGPAS